MKKTLKPLLITLSCCILLGLTMINSRDSQAKLSFTISKSSKPYKKMFMKSKVYNKYTKDYHLIKSYLIKLGNSGGGTLRIKKGKYNISNALAIPSNTEIILENGVRMKKIAKTGTKKLQPGHILFECVRDSRLKKKRILRGYSGEKNISIIGIGDVRVYLEKCRGGQGIRMPHCNNVTVHNIQFKNLKDGHFIEVVGSKNVNITSCHFERNKGGERCAINIDTPDKLTDGFNGQYSKFDKTPVSNITISDCVFLNNYRAIDTHKFSPGKYHTGITIERCTFANNKLSPVKMMNWKNCTIKSCTFNDVNGSKKANIQDEKFGIYIVGGCSELDIEGNCFNGVFIPIFAKGTHAQKYGNKKVKTDNSISRESIGLMKNNIVGTDVVNSFFAISKPGVPYIAKKDKHYDKYEFNAARA